MSAENDANKQNKDGNTPLSGESSTSHEYQNVEVGGDNAAPIVTGRENITGDGNTANTNNNNINIQAAGQNSTLIILAFSMFFVAFMTVLIFVGLFFLWSQGDENEQNTTHIIEDNDNPAVVSDKGTIVQNTPTVTQKPSPTNQPTTSTSVPAVVASSTPLPMNGMFSVLRSLHQGSFRPSSKNIPA